MGFPGGAGAGGGPEAWFEPPAQPPQKDVDARWTKQNAEVHCGCKNPVKADAKSKRLGRRAVPDARVPDSQKLAELGAAADGEVYADSACRSTEAEASGADRTRLRRHEPVQERILPALDWAAAQRGGDWPDQPDLQPGPLRTDRAVEAAATERRLKNEE